MTGLFCEKSVNPATSVDGAFYGRPIQLWYQIAGILTAIGKKKTSLLFKTQVILCKDLLLCALLEFFCHYI